MRLALTPALTIVLLIRFCLVCARRTSKSWVSPRSAAVSLLQRSQEVFLWVISLAGVPVVCCELLERALSFSLLGRYDDHPSAPLCPSLITVRFGKSRERAYFFSTSPMYPSRTF